eukprot:jgi/Chlat1/82/Chrsp1S03199
MWRLKKLKQGLVGDTASSGFSLVGKTVDVGSYRVQVRDVIAQGGFSFVYMAKDLAGRTYALKYVVVDKNYDDDAMAQALQEVKVLEQLQGHPNIITLYAKQYLQAPDQKQELYLLMEYCPKSLVDIANKGTRFTEPQILAIFKSVCAAVEHMHRQSPPIAHRDLKVENVLLQEGTWKLCDFGSSTTRSGRYDSPAEIAAAEDAIRKNTTPAYRAPEMWDLYRREPVTEKVDIWALGCLLYRLMYLTSAFDGESKLQVLNGNYRIPLSPAYSQGMMDLLKSMLTLNSTHRPDIFAVSHRVAALTGVSAAQPSAALPTVQPPAAIAPSTLQTATSPPPRATPAQTPTASPVQARMAPAAVAAQGKPASAAVYNSALAAAAAAAEKARSGSDPTRTPQSGHGAAKFGLFDAQGAAAALRTQPAPGAAAAAATAAVPTGMAELSSLFVPTAPGAAGAHQQAVTASAHSPRVLRSTSAEIPPSKEPLPELEQLRAQLQQVTQERNELAQRLKSLTEVVNEQARQIHNLTITNNTVVTSQLHQAASSGSLDDGTGNGSSWPAGASAVGSPPAMISMRSPSCGSDMAHARTSSRGSLNDVASFSPRGSPHTPLTRSRGDLLDNDALAIKAPDQPYSLSNPNTPPRGPDGWATFGDSPKKTLPTLPETTPAVHHEHTRSLLESQSPYQGSPSSNRGTPTSAGRHRRSMTDPFGNGVDGSWATFK